MTEGLPAGWLPIPYGVPPEDAGELAARLVRTAAESMPGFVDGNDAREALAAAMVRPAVSEGAVGRVWHVLGPEATGVIVDLSMAVGEVPDSPFPLAVVQKTTVFDGGRAVLSFTAPREQVRVAMLLRVQRREHDRVLVADVLGAHPALVERVLDDVIRIVGGTPPAEAGILS